MPVPRPSEVARDNGDSWFARALRAVFGWKAGSIRADLKDVLEDGAGETGFSPTERTMLKNILGLRERRIVDVMVPRADIIAVQREIALGELMKVFESAGHSRLVVYDDTLDDAIGMVHIRDLVAFMTVRAAASAKANTRRKKPFPAGLDLKAIDLSMPLSRAKIIREILYAPPSMPVLDLLAKMQTTRIHLALVVDEYGGADGVVSIEDIVEQIVGEIADEHDEDMPPGVVRQTDGSFLADARASLDDVTSIVGAEFDVGEVAKEVDTLAGYVATRIGRVPVRGELVPGPGPFELEILDADPRRVKKLRIYRGLDREQRQAARHPAAGRRTAATGQRPRHPHLRRPHPPTNRSSFLRDSAIEIRTPAVTLDRLAHTIVRALGLAARPDRISCRRVNGAGAAADDAWPLPFITFPILVWLVDGAAAGRLGGVLAAASAGWWFGFGYFLAGLYWIGNAFLVDAKTFGWLLPFAVVALPAGNGGLHRVRPRVGAAHLDARRNPRAGARGRAHARRMAAWPPLQRLSVERLWLCADLAALARARRGADRALGADLPRRRGLCVARRARRRPRRHEATVAGSDAECRRARRARDLGRRAARANSHQLRRGRAPAHHAAQSAAG